MKKLSRLLLFFGIFGTILRFFGYSIIKNSCYAIDEKCTAEAMVVCERTTGRVLYSKNKDKILPMASTTKIITAIVAIESGIDLDEKRLITKDMTGVEGSSIYLKSGENLSLRELLYGLMLRSGNDSAVAIAMIVGGSVENFVVKMNEFCAGLGLQNTNLVTVNGLHDKNHYTTASDLSKITCYALNNSVFADIVSTKEIKISNELDKKNHCRLLRNKNKLLKGYEGADGVKTGYTMKAGRCFVGSATRNGMGLVCVVLNCREMFEETMRLFDKSFKEYSLELIMKKEDINNYEKNSKTQNSLKILEKDIYLPLNASEKDKIQIKIETFENARDDGQIGFVNFLMENDLIFSEKIYTIIDKSDDKDNSFKTNFKKVILAF